MKFNAMNRRHFLQGAGGFALCLPFMSSLFPQSARAQSQNSLPKYFFGMMSHHGGVLNSNYFPDPTLTSQTEVQLYSGDANRGLDHKIRYSRLTDHLRTFPNPLSSSGATETGLSPVLGSYLNPYLDKINILMGMDMIWGSGHSYQGQLGNAWGSFDSNEEKARFIFNPIPTIDQVMANSSSFYGANDPRTVKTMNINLAGEKPMSAGYISGRVSNMPSPNRLGDLYTQLFGSGQSTPSSESPSAEQSAILNVVDKVFEDYQRLTSGSFGAARRIGSEDKIRLNEFMDQLNELEIRIRNLSSGGSCSQALDPGDAGSLGFTVVDQPVDDQGEIMNLGLLLTAAAFRCGRTRIATLKPTAINDYAGNDTAFHDQVAHFSTGADKQPYMVRSHRYVTQLAFAKMLEYLDVDMGLGNGLTYLDQTAMYLCSEAGETTHDPYSMLMVQAGGGGGAFNTGYFVDYRNKSNRGYPTGSPSRRHPGLPTNRLLNNFLLAMGISPSEYKSYAIPTSGNEGATMYGYGENFQRPEWAGYETGGFFHETMPQRVLDDCDNPMPIISTT